MRWKKVHDSPRRRTNKLALIAVAALGVGLLAGCSSASSNADSAGSAKMAHTADVAVSSDAKGASTQAPMAAAQSTAASPAGGNAKGADTNSADAAAAAAAKAPQSIAPPTAADDDAGFNRKLIYKANLVMEVKDYGDAQTKLRNQAALSGAYILSFTETTNDHEKSGTYTIKVPAKGFASFLDALEQISPTLQRSVQGQDVTEEYVDLDARLKAQQALETRLLAFMDKAQKADDLVAFSNELSKVQTGIEQIKGRMRYLDQNVEMSTVELRLYQKIGLAASTRQSGWLTLGERMDTALNASIHVLGITLQALVVFLAGALPVLLLLLVIFLIYRIYRRRLRHRPKLQTLPAITEQNPEVTPLESDKEHPNN